MIPRSSSQFFILWRQLRGRMAVNAAGTLVLAVLNAVLMLLASLVLARILGPALYGCYVWALAWALLLTVPALLGTERLLIRLVSVYDSRQQSDRATALYNWAIRRVSGASVVLGLMAAGTAWFLLPE